MDITRAMREIEQALQSHLEAYEALECEMAAAPASLWTEAGREAIAEQTRRADELIEALRGTGERIDNLPWEALAAPPAPEAGGDEPPAAGPAAEPEGTPESREKILVLRRKLGNTQSLVEEKNHEIRQLEQRIERLVERSKEAAGSKARARDREALARAEEEVAGWREAVAALADDTLDTEDLLKLLQRRFGERRVIITEAAWRGAREHRRDRAGAQTWRALHDLVGPFLDALRSGQSFNQAADEHLGSRLLASESQVNLTDPKLAAPRTIEYNGESRVLSRHLNLGRWGRAFFDVVEDAEHGKRILLGHCGDHLPTHSRRT